MLTADPSASVAQQLGSELTRTSATIDGASITPLNLSIGVGPTPTLNVIDGSAVKEVMRQLTALTNLMARSLEVLDAKYHHRLKSMEDAQGEVGRAANTRRSLVVVVPSSSSSTLSLSHAIGRRSSQRARTPRTHTHPRSGGGRGHQAERRRAQPHAEPARVCRRGRRRRDFFSPCKPSTSDPLVFPFTVRAR